MLKLARWIIERTVPPERHRACILGDLDELYAVRRARTGRARAALWYWSEAWGALTSYTIDRLRRPRGHTPRYRGSSPNRKAGPMESFRQDVQYALRTLNKSRGFTLVAALTIALGIGATTTIFSVANSVLFRTPHGVRNPGKMVTVHHVATDGSGFHAFGYAAYAAYRDGDNGLSGLAAVNTTMLALSRGDEPDVSMGMVVSRNYFDVVGARPAFGRFFPVVSDEIEDPAQIAVLGHRLWMRRFAGDSAVVGKTITVNRRSFTVIGVAEEGFSGHATLMDVGMYVPLGTTPVITGQTDRAARDVLSIELVGRLAAGVTASQAQQAMSLIAGRISQARADTSRAQGVNVREYTPMLAAAAGPVGGFMALLFAVSAVILLIASVNVGGMLLARASIRGKEMALRLAVGAPRRRLIRQLLTESVLLFVLGGGAGVLLTVYATRLLNAFQLPIPLPVILDFSPDIRALGFSLVTALVTGVVFGLAPALHVTKPDLSTTLKVDASSGGHTRLRSALVITQVAGSALLLVGGGLFLRGLARADEIDIGLDPTNVHATMIDLGLHNYTDAETRAFYDQLMERVAGLPSVDAAALIDNPPLGLGNQTTRFVIEGREPALGIGTDRSDFAVVTPDYFRALRIPLTAGRPFSTIDRDDTQDVVIVNETLARRVWPGESATAKRMLFVSRGDTTVVEVVGVAGNGKYRSLGEPDRNMIYWPHAQAPNAEMTLVARSASDEIGSEIHGIIRSLDPALPLEYNASYRELMGIALLPSQAAAGLASAFGVLGLLLAAVGLYGVLAFTVTQRTREIGIRLALGARESQMRSMVLRQATKLAVVGVAAGFAIALAVTRLIRGLLFGVSPADPIAFVGIATLLLVVALLSALLPAVRATRIDPVRALRSEQ